MDGNVTVNLGTFTPLSQLEETGRASPAAGTRRKCPTCRMPSHAAHSVCRGQWASLQPHRTVPADVKRHLSCGGAGGVPGGAKPVRVRTLSTVWRMRGACRASGAPSMHRRGASSALDRARASLVPARGRLPWPPDTSGRRPCHSSRGCDRRGPSHTRPRSAAETPHRETRGSRAGVEERPSFRCLILKPYEFAVKGVPAGASAMARAQAAPTLTARLGQGFRGTYREGMSQA